MAQRPNWWKRRTRPVVRPWALAGPVIVLLICLPLLRPLWSPGVMSGREMAALDTARNLLEHHTFALDPAREYPPEAVVNVHGKLIARDPTAFTATVAAFAWLCEKGGVTFQNNLHLLDYLLTMFVSALPTAFGCGLIYRLGRAFDLSRPWRVALALVCVLATGWISYATVLLPHAMAIFLVVASVVAFVHVSRAEWYRAASLWLIAAGGCAAAAAAFDPLAFWVLPAVLLGTPFLPASRRGKVAGVFFVLLGAALPIALYVVVNPQATGDLLPPRWHTLVYAGPGPTVLPSVGDDLDPVDVSVWVLIGRAINRLLIFTVGSHGIFSHFPVLVIALAGAGSVLRRHWAIPLKWLAGATLAALVLLLAYKMAVRVDDVDLDFAAPRLIVLVPVLMIWAGSWIRRPHSAAVWTAASVAMVVSVAISILGITAPAPPGGYAHYTAAEAAERLISGPTVTANRR